MQDRHVWIQLAPVTNIHLQKYLGLFVCLFVGLKATWGYNLN